MVLRRLTCALVQQPRKLSALSQMAVWPWAGGFLFLSLSYVKLGSWSQPQAERMPTEHTVGAQAVLCPPRGLPVFAG